MNVELSWCTRRCNNCDWNRSKDGGVTNYFITVFESAEMVACIVAC